MNKIIFFISIFSIPLFSSEIFLQDAKNFYQKETFKTLFKVFIPSAIFANTSIDQDLQHFYIKNIKSTKTDKASKTIKLFGSNKPLSIAFFSSVAASYFLQQSEFGTKLYDFSTSTFRSITVGIPLVILGQNILGADRPNQNTTSNWQPFKNDHGISGHAFMGAVPFITLANMSNNLLTKSLLYIGSTLVGLSRINDNSHYTSQVILGWTLAYSSCKAIAKTNTEIQISSDKITFGGKF